MIQVINRRRTLKLMGLAGVTALTKLALPSAQAASTFACVTAPAETEGPYFVEESLNRSDICVDPTNGAISPGAMLNLKMTIHQVSSSSCGILPGARVEIWHCDAAGVYSDEAANSSVGRKFLRGYQIADDNGVVNFTTIYPGWYQGRTVHIHIKVRTYSGASKIDEFTTQLFFDDTLTDSVFTQAPYNTRRSRDTRNANDMILTSTQNSSRLMLDAAQSGSGYAASIDIGVNLKTPTVSRAIISSGGVVNAASNQPGVAPGAWITIYGANLAASTRAAATADLVNGSLPTALGGVTVSVDNQPAFIQYVSPTQINVQAPADSNSGSVMVTVTNGNGVSDPVIATLQPIFPAFFASQNYVAAVRADGVSITAAQPAKVGDSISLFGTGFGNTNPGVAPGVLIQTAAPLTEAVTISIGGAAVTPSFAGLSAAGLYQFNVTVPSLPAGDHEVVAQIAGRRTQPGVLLKVQS